MPKIPNFIIYYIFTTFDPVKWHIIRHVVRELAIPWYFLACRHLKLMATFLDGKTAWLDFDDKIMACKDFHKIAHVTLKLRRHETSQCF